MKAYHLRIPDELSKQQRHDDLETSKRQLRSVDSLGDPNRNKLAIARSDSNDTFNLLAVT